MFEVNRTFGSRAITIFRQRRMIAPPPPVLIRVKGVNKCFKGVSRIFQVFFSDLSCFMALIVIVATGAQEAIV